MSPECFQRINLRSTQLISFVVVAAAALMWLATAADHLFGLRWGWDIENLWTAPIIATVALIVRILARAVSRWVGAAD